MFARMEIGRIAGIPIYLDMMFVLVLLIFSYPYFTAGNPQLMSAGFIIVIGLLLSILLHELGHAFAGRLFNAPVSHIDLTGLGGVALLRAIAAEVGARSLGHLPGGTGGQSAALARPGHAGWSGGRRGQSDGRVAARRAVLQQLPAAVFQPAARLSARRRPYDRCLARRVDRTADGPPASSRASASSWLLASPTGRSRTPSSSCWSPS